MAIDELTYPQPVANRQGPAVGSLAAVATSPTPPISHTIPFQIVTPANTRTTVSAGPFKGPAIVHALHYSKTSPGDVTQGLYLGVAPNAVTETSVAVSSSRPFRPLFDPRLLGNISASPAVGPYAPLVDNVANPMLTDWNDAGIIILDTEFWLTITAEATTVGGDQHNGYLTLLEQVSRAALANFL
jgi:hypothetical protein